MVEIGQRKTGHEGTEPEGDLGDLGPHRREIHPVDAALEDEALEQGRVLDTDAERAAGARPQRVELLAQRRQGEIAKQSGELVGQLVENLDEEVGAAARRVDDRKVEELGRCRARIPPASFRTSSR